MHISQLRERERERLTDHKVIYLLAKDVSLSLKQKTSLSSIHHTKREDDTQYIEPVKVYYKYTVQ